MAFLEMLCKRIQEHVPDEEPLIIAGDFNDWRSKRGGVSRALSEGLGLVEVFEEINGKPARTFPAIFPMLKRRTSSLPTRLVARIGKAILVNRNPCL